MADNSKIEWTDATWNPITGCMVVSPGCTNCYAMKLAGTRLQHHPSRAGLTIDTKAGPVWNGEVTLNEKWLDQPRRWTRPRRIFVCAHGDLFYERVSDSWIDQVFRAMAAAPQHTYQILTKRPDRAVEYINWPGSDYRPPKIWWGTSAEDQSRADERIPDLLKIPKGPQDKLFVSLEPLLGPVDLTNHRVCNECGNTPHVLWKSDPHADPTKPWDDDQCPLHWWPNSGCEGTLHHKIDWVIAGGESGPGARPMHPAWVRSLRDQCQEEGVAFHFKQWGEFTPADPADAHTAMHRVGKKAAGAMLDGREWREFPA